MAALCWREPASGRCASFTGMQLWAQRPRLQKTWKILLRKPPLVLHQIEDVSLGASQTEPGAQPSSASWTHPEVNRPPCPQTGTCHFPKNPCLPVSAAAWGAQEAQCPALPGIKYEITIWEAQNDRICWKTTVHWKNMKMNRQLSTQISIIHFLLAGKLFLTRSISLIKSPWVYSAGLTVITLYCSLEITGERASENWVFWVNAFLYFEPS